MKIGVIGAGISGLATAALLAKAGHEVVVWEKNPFVGGRAFVWTKKHFTFDMGPSWYLMPEVFERFFAQFGKKPNDFYQLDRLDPSYRVYWGDSSYTDVPTSKKAIQSLFASFESNGGNKLRAFLDKGQRLYQMAMDDFLYQDYCQPGKYIKIRTIKELVDSNMFGSYDTWVDKHFTNQRARKILKYPSVFLGGTPKNTPAIYSMMNYVDLDLGVWYPQGGIGELIKALVSLCKEFGVTIKTNHEVTQIDVAGGVVKKVYIGTHSERVDVLISSGDLPWLQQLISAKYQDYGSGYWQTKTMAPAMVLVYLGLSKKIPQLQHHNFYFSDQWDEHFDSITQSQLPPPDPSWYVSCPSRVDTSITPKGGEVLFGLVPIAAGLGVDNCEYIAQNLISKLEILTGQSINNRIQVKRVIGITEFTELFRSYQGSALGLAHTLWQSAFMRPKLQSRKVANLFFTGGYTSPGIGMPMALISGQLVAQRVGSLYDR